MHMKNINYDYKKHNNITKMKKKLESLGKKLGYKYLDTEFHLGWPATNKKTKLII